MASGSKKVSRRESEPHPKAENGADAPPPARRHREAAIIGALVVGWLIYVLWSALSQQKAGEATTVASPAPATTDVPAGYASLSPVGPETDADLLVNDLVAGLITLQRVGPADLRVTQAQRDHLAAVWPDIKKNLQSNATQPSAVDAKMRAILTPAQKGAIRKMATSGQLALPPHLNIYVSPFEQLLRGVPITAASGEPSSTTTLAAASPTPEGAGTPSSTATPASATPTPDSAGTPSSSATPTAALPAPNSAGVPNAAASGATQEDPGKVVDPFLDLFLHDMIGGLLSFQEDGPETLRLTPSQRQALTALQDKIRKRLEGNDQKPTALDDQVRAILTPAQKSAIRTLLSQGKISLPSSLAAYAKPFDMLLAGRYTKGAMQMPMAAAPGTPSPASGAHAGSPGDGKAQAGAKPSADQDFKDIFLHDAVGGLIVIERDGPSALRLSTAQRKQIEKLWPDIRHRLEANDWKPSALDGKVVGILTPQQRTALRALRASGKVPPPPRLSTYVAPFDALLKKS